MVPAFEKQEVKNTGRYSDQQATCQGAIALKASLSVAEVSKGAREVAMMFMNLHQGQRHACLSKVYLGSLHTASASAVTENG